MTEQAWTIARIEQALGDDVLRERFAAECAAAPVAEVAEVYAKWTAIAQQQERESGPDVTEQ